VGGSNSDEETTMTTLILTVVALLVLAAIQCAGAGDARSAANLQVVVKRPVPAHMLSDIGPQLRGIPMRTHVARNP
jgi:hypothetical protein